MQYSVWNKGGTRQLVGSWSPNGCVALTDAWLAIEHYIIVSLDRSHEAACIASTRLDPVLECNGVRPGAVPDAAVVGAGGSIGEEGT